MARTVFLASLIAIATASQADLTGPAPLAWRWSQSTSVSPAGPLVVSGNVVYAAVGGRVYAIDKESGNGLWRFPSGAPIESGNFKTGVYAGGGLVIAACDNKLVYAMDAETGNQKWQYIAPEKVVGTPVTAGNFTALQLADNSIMVLNTADGSPAWERPVRFLDGIVGQIASYRESIIFGTQSDNVYALDAVTKKVNWKQRLGRFNSEFKPVVYNDNIYCVNSDYITVLSGASGGRRWEKTVHETGAFFASVNSAGVAVATREGGVAFFDLSGRELLRKNADLGSFPTAAPSLANGVVVVPTSNGAINLLDTKTGLLKWNFIVRPLLGATQAASDTTGGAPTGRGRGGGTTTTDDTPKYVSAASAPILAGNSLLQIARDGSILCFDKENGVDLTPPTVKMLFPNAGDAVNGQPPLQLFFKVADESSGIDTKSLKVLIGGKEYESRMNDEGYVFVKFTGGKNQPMMDGRKEIVVKIKDWLGNEASQKFFLTIDNALPPIKLPGTDDTTQPGSRGGKGGGAPGGLGG